MVWNDDNTCLKIPFNTLNLLGLDVFQDNEKANGDGGLDAEAVDINDVGLTVSTRGGSTVYDSDSDGYNFLDFYNQIVKASKGDKVTIRHESSQGNPVVEFHYFVTIENRMVTENGRSVDYAIEGNDPYTATLAHEIHHTLYKNGQPISKKINLPVDEKEILYDISQHPFSETRFYKEDSDYLGMASVSVEREEDGSVRYKVYDYLKQIHSEFKYEEEAISLFDKLVSEHKEYNLTPTQYGYKMVVNGVKVYAHTEPSWDEETNFMMIGNIISALKMYPKSVLEMIKGGRGYLQFLLIDKKYAKNDLYRYRKRLIAANENIGIILKEYTKFPILSKILPDSFTISPYDTPLWGLNLELSLRKNASAHLNAFSDNIALSEHIQENDIQHEIAHKLADELGEDFIKEFDDFFKRYMLYAFNKVGASVDEIAVWSKYVEIYQDPFNGDKEEVKSICKKLTSEGYLHWEYAGIHSKEFWAELVSMAISPHSPHSYYWLLKYEREKTKENLHFHFVRFLDKIRYALKEAKTREGLHKLLIDGLNSLDFTQL